MSIDLNKVRMVHCVGIGGIGVSAIARMLHLQGKRVTGSDTARSPVTAMLRKLGIKIIIGHRASNVDGAGLVVYTKAVGSGNPELRAARRRGIPCFSYAEMLGLISRHRYTIAVAGAHGKTTTTAMVGHILHKAKFNPTIIVGGVMADTGTNFVAGRGRYFVVEACEYKKSFLDINPRIIVITNIDNDHLDYYKNLTNIKRAFGEFAAKLGNGGFLVCDPNDPNVRGVARKTSARVVNYRRMPLRVKLHVLGAHHRRNAQAALAVARVLGVPMETAERALKTFHGVGRRFEYKGTWRGVKFYDDYAHHPTEIRATLKAAREHFGKKRRIWCVFQPHLYSRTRLLMKDFARSFGDADQVLLADIYAAREKDDGKTNSRVLAEKININTPALYLGTFPRIAAFLRMHSKGGDVVITMGAGEAYKVWELVRK
ncbi:MAG: UDP-N-acetylmuramate--L-alanine ligase [Candidatus Jorgensenbacteria bacterium]